MALKAAEASRLQAAHDVDNFLDSILYVPAPTSQQRSVTLLRLKPHLLEVGLHHLQKCICQQCNFLRATLPTNLHMAVNRERVDEGSIVKLHYMCGLELCF